MIRSRNKGGVWLGLETPEIATCLAYSGSEWQTAGVFAPLDPGHTPLLNR